MIVASSVVAMVCALCFCQNIRCPNVNSSSTAKLEIIAINNQSTTASSIVSYGKSDISPSSSSLKFETQDRNYSTRMSSFTDSSKMTISAAVTGHSTSGQYSSKVQLSCSFPDEFKPAYKDIRSSELKNYLNSMFVKLGGGLALFFLNLQKILVYSVKQGSIVVEMILIMRSNLMINDESLIKSVRNATHLAFGGAVTIQRMAVIQSSMYISKKLANWVIGLAVFIVLAIILLIIAVVLFYRYFPASCTCCRKPPRNSSPSPNPYESGENIFEMEYEGYSDMDVIYNRNANQNIV